MYTASTSICRGGLHVMYAAAAHTVAFCCVSSHLPQEGSMHQPLIQ